MGGNGGGVEFEYKHIVWALAIMITLPILISIYAPAPDATGSEWEDEVANIQNTYINNGGGQTANINIWPLVGIYLPYDGTTHGMSADGWLYGERVANSAPSQYQSDPLWSGEKFSVTRNSQNGLYYYNKSPSNCPDIVGLNGAYGQSDVTHTYEEATIYSAVTMDVAHKSDVFFTTGGKTVEGDGYYYEYGQNAYRYAFAPLTNYTTTAGGTTYEVDPHTSSLSLIWYEYVDIDGIAGQLTITGKDYGVSYLTSDDIIRAYDSANMSARFNMMFGTIPMHLMISLNPYAVANGYSIAQIWNQGWWSVMVYSDQDATSAAVSQTYEFSPDKVLDTAIKLFSFDIDEEYNIDGWMAILVSATFSLAFYACLIALALNHAYLWILVAIVAAIQGMKFW